MWVPGVTLRLSGVEPWAGEHPLPTVPFYWHTMVFNNDIIGYTLLLSTLEQ